MALSYRARKRLSLLILVIGLPVYIIVAVNLVDAANARWGRMPLWGEFAIFVGIGILWAIPLRRVFLGVGQPDPEADPKAGSDGHPPS